MVEQRFTAEQFSSEGVSPSEWGVFDWKRADWTWREVGSNGTRTIESFPNRANAQNRAALLNLGKGV